ncbi:O-antigen ligase domain-containing protein [Candidatus Halocynthiibacter alkanivorans]|uniref:O-antigen ligase domain-containing protein n=1 Tax=Candidatus Halocynthiibacter alkanivorans TaxID=2267619 RepID=UPI001F27407F|nr:O-antigen ligase domain-containing protein [Candidatus Halocynthiibacter alkanivorans]
MSAFSPRNPAETMLWRALIWTWPFYFIGALYVVGPVLAWLMGGLAVLALYLGPAIRADLRPAGPVPPVVTGWILGMILMLIVLLIGHVDWDLSLRQTIKSTVGWAKGWALLALFPLAGAVLPVRRALLVRGQCVVGAWTLALAPLMLLAPTLGLPERIFVSPLRAVGGPGPEYFTVFLFTWDPATWTPRWQFFAPWSPFAALLGVMMFLFALEEKHRGWRGAGLLAGMLMVFASKSRMGLVGLLICPVGPRLMPLLLRGWAWHVGAALIASLAVFGTTLATALGDGVYAFKMARADSTRVRATLQRIAEERWQNEAPWFGHGTIQPGSHLVEYMPIGSHHTWYGLLFIKGLAGFCALLIPLVWNTGLALVDATRHARGRLPLGILMTIMLLSFGENLEIQVYLLWPGLVMLGIHAREMHAGCSGPGTGRKTGRGDQDSVRKST